MAAGAAETARLSRQLTQACAAAESLEAQLNLQVGTLGCAVTCVFAIASDELGYLLAWKARLSCSLCASRIFFCSTAFDL